MQLEERYEIGNQADNHYDVKINMLKFLLSTDISIMFIYSHVYSSGSGCSELDRHFSISWKTQVIFTKLPLN
jgi:hypothetical protein